MTKPFREVMAEFSPERRADIQAEADRLLAEYYTLQELRKAKALTQAQLANALGIRQATVAQMEKRTDLLLSTLRSYVEAMGGKLSLIVEFPDRVPVHLTGLGDTEELPPRRPLAVQQPLPDGSD